MASCMKVNRVRPDIKSVAGPLSLGASTSYVRIPVARVATSVTGRRSGKLQIACSSIVPDDFQRPPVKYFDAEKELSRKYRRTVFSHEDWFKHRSTSRYARHLSGLFVSRIVRGLALPIGTVMSIATFVTVYELLRESGSLGAEYPSLAVASPQPFNLTSFALSLLLVFRTNASYGRWDEARKLWGGVVNRSRDIVRQGLTFFPDGQDELKETLGRWTSAFPFALKSHLTYGEDLESDLKNILKPEELQTLLKSTHRPNLVMRSIAETVRSAKLSGAETFLMDHNFTFYADACGSCERILSTPIPLSYTRHTSRFLMVWLIFLPFLLYSSCHLLTAPVAGVISLLLLGIEEIGVQIEEPFSILPLDGISKKIAGNIGEMLEMREETEILIPRPLQSGNGRGGFFPNGSSGELSAAELDRSAT